MAGLPESLWLSSGDRIGIGGFLGFPDSIATLRFISVPFWRMCKMPEMHPIVNYDPWGDLRWGNGLDSWDKADRQQWRGTHSPTHIDEGMGENRPICISVCVCVCGLQVF